MDDTAPTGAPGGHACAVEHKIIVAPLVLRCARGRSTSAALLSRLAKHGTLIRCSILCRVEGTHHSDPQDLVTIRHRTVTMNSWAGLVLLSVGLLTGITIITLAIGLKQQLGNVASRALVVWGIAPPAFSVFLYTCVRLPGTSNRKIAALVFAGFTALLLPIITFLLA